MSPGVGRAALWRSRCCSPAATGGAERHLATEADPELTEPPASGECRRDGSGPFGEHVQDRSRSLHEWPLFCWCCGRVGKVVCFCRTVFPKFSGNRASEACPARKGFPGQGTLGGHAWGSWPSAQGLGTPTVEGPEELRTQLFSSFRPLVNIQENWLSGQRNTFRKMFQQILFLWVFLSIRSPPTHTLPKKVQTRNNLGTILKSA